MIERQDNVIEINCDYCPMSDERQTADFHEALESFKEDGWKAINRSGEWQHKCPDCTRQS